MRFIVSLCVALVSCLFSQAQSFSDLMYRGTQSEGIKEAALGYSEESANLFMDWFFEADGPLDDFCIDFDTSRLPDPLTAYACLFDGSGDGLHLFLFADRSGPAFFIMREGEDGAFLTLSPVNIEDGKFGDHIAFALYLDPGQYEVLLLPDNDAESVFFEIEQLEG